MRCLVFLAILVPLMSALADEPSRKIKPVVVLGGTDSLIEKESVYRCCTREEWRECWFKHISEEKASKQNCPEIDFESNMVIAIFHGGSMFNYGLDIIQVSEEKETLSIKYKPWWYQTLSTGTRELEKHSTKSFAFIVLPKSPKAVVCFENVENTHGNPPKWKEKFKVEAVKAK